MEEDERATLRSIMMDLVKKPYEKIKLSEINSHLTCRLCEGYYVDATTISECLHSFCRSCIIKFLKERSYCPICEVIINKAKPNLKLDKTLQDIVYKLVPELFLNEMRRRQQFYQKHPNVAAKVTPEERGEDTERTIFNPRDTISLSIEYISDDSTPGELLIPQLIERSADVNCKANSATNGGECSSVRRFLQCSGMCRVDVLKKFIANKYSVDTSRYYIDILYKRVPLPDHYTLIDVAYIYSWKRNEPMKFFFKITDIHLVTDSFDYLIQPQINKELKEKNLKTPPAEVVVKPPPKVLPKSDSESPAKKAEPKKPNPVNPPKPKEKEYTNITLDRTNNVEIITKIQKVSNKNGLPIGLKITKQTVKKANGPKTSEPKKSVELPKDLDLEKSNFLKSIELTAKSTTPASTVPKKETPPKRKISSTAKTPKAIKKAKKLANIQPKPRQIKASPKANDPDFSPNGKGDLQALLFDSYKINIPASLSVTVKNERDGPTPSSLQKPVQNYIEILKIPEAPDKDNADKTAVENKLSGTEEAMAKSDSSQESKKTDAHESPTETTKSLKTPTPPPPPQQPKTPTCLSQSPPQQLTPSPPTSVAKAANSSPKEPYVKLNPRSSQTFQKMFEEAIKKPEFNNKFQTLSVTKTEIPLFASKNEPSATTPTPPKRNILEIASKLYKKTKMEQEKNTMEKKSESLNLAKPMAKPLNLLQKGPKPHDRGNPPLKDFNSYISSKPPPPPSPQTVTNLHSPALGMNYTVSVAQSAKRPYPSELSKPKTVPLLEVDVGSSPLSKLAATSPRIAPHHEPARKRPISPKFATPPKEPLESKKTTPNSIKTPPHSIKTPPNASKLNLIATAHSENKQPLSPNKILEQYNIQNLAQLTANFNFSPNLCVGTTASQLAAIQQAMIYRHFEMQNHQNWLNMNQGSLMQYEKYLKSLSKS